jgi:hypothetical protein
MDAPEQLEKSSKRKSLLWINTFIRHGAKNSWTMSTNQDKPSNKAKLLFLNDWVTQTIPKMMPDSNESKEEQYEFPMSRY